MPDFYGSLADADAYHAARGNHAWLDRVADDRTAALVRGSAWLDGSYANRWPGKRTGGREQDRAWPRTGAKDAEGYEIGESVVPVEVEMASYEAALREATTPGSLAPDWTPAEGIKSETVGPISQTYRDGVGPDGHRPIVSVIDDILASLIGRRQTGVATQKLLRA